jgi:hypothetical protein
MPVAVTLTREGVDIRRASAFSKESLPRFRALAEGTGLRFATRSSETLTCGIEFAEGSDKL